MITGFMKGGRHIASSLRRSYARQRQRLRPRLRKQERKRRRTTLRVTRSGISTSSPCMREMGRGLALSDIDIDLLLMGNGVMEGATCTYPINIPALSVVAVCCLHPRPSDLFFILPCCTLHTFFTTNPYTARAPRLEQLSLHTILSGASL